MNRSLLLSLLAAAAAGVPFLFGIIRAMTTGNDFRYLWVALASAIGGAVSMRWPARATSARGVLALSAVVFVIATAAAVLAARFLGTVIGPGLLVVGSSFGLCFAGAAGLLAMSRSTTV